MGYDPKVKKKKRVVRNGKNDAYISQSITLGPNVNWISKLFFFFLIISYFQIFPVTEGNRCLEKGVELVILDLCC